MLADATRYPIAGQWPKRTAIGSLLVVGSPVLLPAVALVGYGVVVLERTTSGDAKPPTFDDWATLLERGLGGSVVLSTYLFVPIVVSGIVLGIAGGIGYALLLAIAPLVGGSEAVVWAISALAALLASLLALTAMGGMLAAYCFIPAALTAYAGTGTVRGAIDPRTLTPTVASQEYLRALVFLQILPVVVVVLAGLTAATIVGILAVPTVMFLGYVGSCRLVGTAIRDVEIP